MSKPLVSIIIPSYNSKPYLKEAVACALNQSYKPIEIILVDDGSTDCTNDLFPEFENQGVRCFSIDNGGASNARNYGLDKASGDYIQFLDADDILDAYKIEKQLALMQLQQAEISYTYWINFKKQVKSTQKKFKFSHLEHSLNRSGKELMISFGMDNWFILTVSWLVKRSLIEAVGLWNIEISNNDDGEYFTRLLYHTLKVVCINEVLCYHRVGQINSLSKMNSKDKIESAFNSFELIKNFLENDVDKKLLCYPKRLSYMQYRMVKKNYPKLAKRAARNFDRIQAPSFLQKKRYYWFLINRFGLYNGTKLYKFLQPLWTLVKRNKTS